MNAIEWLDQELQKEMTIEHNQGRSYLMIPLDTYMNRKAVAQQLVTNDNQLTDENPPLNFNRITNDEYSR